jgi:hypothetical protein
MHNLSDSTPEIDFMVPVSLYDARSALEENLRLLPPDKYRPAANTNKALLGICDALERLKEDVGLLHNKLQPILKELSDDQDEWHQMARRRQK